MQAVGADVQADQRLRLGLEKRDQRIKLKFKELKYGQSSVI
jgi:hypothetical protein